MDLYQQNPQFQLAEKICTTLRAEGFEALLAGGCVRDFLLHRQPHDFDVATSAHPDAVESLFAKTVSVGKSFGVIVVVEGDHQVEVATFRKDGPYKDGRRPESVEFSQAQEDAKRRDFTVNGLFYDLGSREVLDYVGGLEDLKSRRIRAIGEPSKRFAEDHLRLLRAVRFSAQLGFEIEHQTWLAVQGHRDLIRNVSGERIQDEMTKLLQSAFVENGLRLLFESRLLASLLGREDLQWQDPHGIFARKEPNSEDRWFRFFFWLRGLVSTDLDLRFFEDLCDQWKFSRDLKQKTLKSLKWILERQIFQRHSLGELLDLGYQAEHLRGILEYAEFFLSPDEKSAYERFLSRRSELGPERPKPWVRASDFQGKHQGEALGRALRTCYWEQLEGRAPSRSELLKLWGV